MNLNKILTAITRAVMLDCMDQIPLFNDRFWTVSTLTGYIRSLLEGNITLQDCWVRGEISNLSRPGSGHIYFTLKDAGAALRCVVWRTDSQRIRYAWMEGEEVEAHGRVSVYPVNGQYQLVVDAIQPVGEGLLYQQFLRLKARLEAEGLFELSRKRPIPAQPSRIGLVTSATGAAVQDMLQTISRRFPLAEVILCTTPVQGSDAPPKIVNALQRVVAESDPQVIILARGGGSLEDLWAFNDEQVVRAISNCPVPVVTGIGHETDFTLADFAADLRAPTPTAAAELVTPDRMELIANLLGLQKLLWDIALNRTGLLRQKLNHHLDRLKLSSPLTRVQMGRQALDDYLERLRRAYLYQAELRKMNLTSLTARLSGMSPDVVVGRGYAIVTQRGTNRVISSVQQVGKGDKISVRVRDGSFNAVAGDEN